MGAHNNFVLDLIHHEPEYWRKKNFPGYPEVIKVFLLTPSSERTNTNLPLKPNIREDLENASTHHRPTDVATLHHHPAVLRIVPNSIKKNFLHRTESGCEEQKSTNSCFFCCPRGTIVASAELKRKGFVPGEIAPLIVDIHNMSNSSITTLKAVIWQMVEYSSSTGLRRHDDERRVLEVNRGEVKPGSSASWGSAGVRLPPLPPSSFTQDSCKIISIHYRIDIVMYISGMKEPLTLRLPIIIGNIPLKRHFALLASREEMPDLLEATFPRQTLVRYPHLPGTTSQESVNPEQSECVYKLPTFKPRYMVYVPKSLLK